MNTMIILVGGTASGKSHIMDNMIDTGKYDRIITTTTRPMRAGEINGVHYHFVSVDEFQSMIDNNELIEWEQIGVNQHFYGTQKKSIMTMQKTPVIIVEPKGLKTWEEKAPTFGYNVFSVFVWCDPTVKLNRINARTIDTLTAKMIQNHDTLHDMTQEIAEQIKEHTKRIISMYSVERDWFTESHWGTVVSGESNNALEQIESAINFAGAKTYLN